MVPLSPALCRVKIAVGCEQDVFPIAAECSATGIIPGVGERSFGFGGEFIQENAGRCPPVWKGVNNPFAVRRPVIFIEFPAGCLVNGGYNL